jgi:hypothetical protein
MKKDKRSQVDVALAIGSIIIPVAALFGALIFAFVMVSQYGDAAKIAAVISHDTVTLADVAYSVPDTIKIYYQPPKSYCSFSEPDKISCLNGFMNLSGVFKFETTSLASKLKENCTDVPYSLEVSIPALLPPGTLDKNGIPVQLPMIINYPGFANMKDPAILMGGSKSEIVLEVNNAIIVQKNRKSIFDTLDKDIQDTDPLFMILQNMLDACNSQDKTKTVSVMSYFILPHNYNLNRTSESNVLSLTRFSQSPLNIYSNDAKYTNWSVIEFFDISKLNGQNCTFQLNNTFVSGVLNYTEPRGNSIAVESNVSCIASCNVDNPKFNVITRINVTAIRGLP